jgi:hypothetical protein
MNEELKSYLDQYIEAIKKFHCDLRAEYQFEGSAFLSINKRFLRKGNFNEMEYQFHGSGCSVYFKSGVELHYDVRQNYERDAYILVSSWKFFQYIHTSLPDKNGKTPTQEDVAMFLKCMDFEIEKGSNAWYIVEKLNSWL